MWGKIKVKLIEQDFLELISIINEYCYKIHNIHNNNFTLQNYSKTSNECKIKTLENFLWRHMYYLTTLSGLREKIRPLFVTNNQNVYQHLVRSSCCFFYDNDLACTIIRFTCNRSRKKVIKTDNHNLSFEGCNYTICPYLYKKWP